MPDNRVRALLRHAPPRPADDRPDHELLDRFRHHRDEAAFEALVRRHGPMVRAVCRGALRNPADADDAFQATFLVLVRRADAIRDRTAIGGWLYRVAYRVARRLRQTAPVGPLVEEPPARPEPDAERRRVLDEEVARLPEKYRVVVQLCYAAGRTTDDAARALGWAKGTVLTRLAWARRRLRARLTQRGVAASVMTGSVGVGPELVARTVRAAVAVAAGDVLGGIVSDRTVTLTEGVVRTMAVNKLKWVAAALLLAVALTGVGLGRWTANTATAEPGDKKKAAPTEPAAEPADDAPKAPARAREFVVNRPAGTWVRELPGLGRVTLRFDEDRLYGTAEIAEGGKRYTANVEADYSFNKESTVYGVVTGVECDMAEAGLELEVLLTGQPFAFRFRADDGSLTIKDIKGLGIGIDKSANDLQGEATMLLAGRYTPADAARAPARPAKPVPMPRRSGPVHLTPERIHGGS